MIGIICAMEVELRKLYAAMAAPAIQRVMGYVFYTGTIHGRPVVLVQCGIGKVNAAVCCQTMLMQYHPEIVINSGVAGSLSRELEILDVAVAQDVVQHDVDSSAMGDPKGLVSTVNITYFPCDAEVNRGILNAIAAQPGLRGRLARMASGDQFISDAARKRQIVELFQAHACDMEAGAIAQTCYIAKTRCAVIRAISDATDDSHQLEYSEFVARAADNAANVLLAYLANA